MSDLPTLANDSGWLVIWNDIKTFGAGFWAFLILINIYILKDQIKQLVSLFIRSLSFTKKLKYTKKDIEKHKIFKNIDYWLSIGLKAIKIRNYNHFEDEDYANNKEKMAKEVLRIIYETTRDSLRNFIEEYDIDNIDGEVLCKYFLDCLTKNNITEKQKFVERGISSKFLNKFYVLSNISDNLIMNSVRGIYNREYDLSPATKTYIAYNLIDGYLSIIFNNLLETINTINGDLKSETFDGEPMCGSYKAILRAPNPSYPLIVQEKLSSIINEFECARAYICKYYTKEGEKLHSVVYEKTMTGVTSEIANIQGINDDTEKNIYNILHDNGCVACDISKFSTTTISRFNARGIKGIVVAPIYNDEKIDGCLCLDYISYEKFEHIMTTLDLDNMLKKRCIELAPYIVYPKNYAF